MDRISSAEEASAVAHVDLVEEVGLYSHDKSRAAL